MRGGSVEITNSSQTWIEQGTQDLKSSTRSTQDQAIEDIHCMMFDMEFIS